MPDTPSSDVLERAARECLAVAHENAKKPLVAVDIRTGNLGRQGVMWVETTTALAAISATIERLSEELAQVKSKGHLCPNCGAFTSGALSDTKAG